MNVDEFKKRYNKETYLGNSLYASFDSNKITLRTTRDKIDHYIVLDALTLGEFLGYKERLFRDAAKVRQ